MSALVAPRVRMLPAGAAAYLGRLAVRLLQPEPYRKRNPVPETHRGHIPLREGSHHGPVAAQVIGPRQINAALRKPQPRHIGRNPGIRRRRLQRRIAPAVENHMRKRRIKQRFFHRFSTIITVFHGFSLPRRGGGQKTRWLL